MKRITLIVTGRVQAVGYRAWTVREAEKLGLAGWVRNRGDGSVEITAEGREETLRHFLSLCKEGPPAAAVETVTATWSDPTGEFRGFEMIY